MHVRNFSNWLIVLIFFGFWTCAKKKSFDKMEESLQGHQAELTTIKSAQKEMPNQDLEPEEKYLFQNYSLFKDSVRVLDEYSLKYDNNVFIWQNINEKKNYEQARQNKEVSQVIEYRLGVVAIEKFRSNASEISELRFYNENRQRINSWDVQKNNPWKKMLGKEFDPNSVYTEYSKSPISISELPAIKPRYYSNYCDYEVYKNSGNTCLYYILSGLDDEKRVLFKSTYIIILDSLGNELFRTKEDFKMVGHALLSKDKEYIFINGGGLVVEGFERLHNSFLKIIEVPSNKIIHFEERKDINEDFSEFIVYNPTPNLVYVSVSSHNRTYCDLSIIYDLIKMQRCEKYYTKDDCKRIDIEKIPFSPNNRLKRFNYTCSELINN